MPMRKPIFLMIWFIVALMYQIPAYAEPVKILVFGDSLASGYGLREADGFCGQLEKSLNNKGVESIVINAGIAGDTTISGVSRADITYEIEHDIVILEIGANDMLRGIPPQITQTNLKTLIEKSEKPLYLLGMRAFPNYGLLYARAFNAIYPSLADDYELGFYPFIFEEVFADGLGESAKYFQRDRLHLNAEGVRVITDSLSDDLINWMGEEALLLNTGQGLEPVDLAK